jgi:hypothetical protein
MWGRQMGDDRDSPRAQVAGLAFADDSTGADTLGSTIGGAPVEEPLFLDEPADYTRPAPPQPAASPFELFANEDEPPLWATFPTQGAPGVAAGPAVGSATTGRRAPTRPSLLSVYLLIAGIAVIAAFTAYQGSWLPVGLWSLLER